MAAAALNDASITSTIEDARTHSWPPLLRYGFRFAFCYFLTYIVCCGNATFWQAIPVIGQDIAKWLALPFRLFGQYLAQHVVHVQGVGATLHASGSGDKAIDWLVLAQMLTLALLASLVWTILDRRRQQYQTLAAWLRFLIRLALGMGMVAYGFAKVFPLQMQPPILAVLNEPVGNMSPMTMLWTLLGLNPLYQMICGGAELTAGLLILFRRTALAGALLTAFVMSNVVLYNFFFDVPVKLYASNLLLMALFVVLPDVQPLFSFFWKHETAAPRGIWVPPASRVGFRRATAIVEVAYLLLAVGSIYLNANSSWTKISQARRTNSILRGGWHLDSATVHGQARPLLVNVDQPVTALYVENVMYGYMRSADAALWRTPMKVDEAKQTIELHPISGKGGTYKIAMQGQDRLQLTPMGPGADKQPVLAFTRIPLANSYPLLNRGFHLVNEWGLER